MREVRNSSIGWYNLYDNSAGIRDELTRLHWRYESAVAECSPLANPSAVRTAARALLQEFYGLLPFDTMKRAEYDYHVRPPE